MRNKLILTLLTLLLLTTPKLSASDWVTDNFENSDWMTSYSPEENWTLWDSYGNQDWSTLPADMVLEMIIGKEDTKLFGLDDDDEDKPNEGGTAGDGTPSANDVPMGDGVGIILLLIATYVLRYQKSVIAYIVIPDLIRDPLLIAGD